MLVLPGHGLPFHGLHARIAELIDHHAHAAARLPMHADSSRCPSRTRPYVFQRILDEHQTGFAFGEVLAHVNYMLGHGQLVLETGPDGIDRYRAR